VVHAAGGVDRGDQELAAAALRKRASGQRASREEAAALRRVQRAREEEQRAAWAAAVPKKDWAQWSGRQHKTLNEQAVRYGVPVGGRTIDLREVAHWLHDFLADNARRLATDDEGEDLDYWKAKRERVKYEQDVRNWLPRSDVHDGLRVFAEHVRKAGERLQKQFGAEAHDILERALDLATKALDRHLGDPDS